MENNKTKIRRSTPFIIWCVRLCFCATIFYISKYWLISVSVNASNGQIILGGLIVLSIVALLASFVRSKKSVVIIMLAIIAIPLFVFLGMDFFVLNNALWKNCIALLLQMTIPFAFAFYLWKAPNVREYYFATKK